MVHLIKAEFFWQAISVFLFYSKIEKHILNIFFAFKNYLINNQFKNVNQNNLWDELQIYTNLEIKQIMNSWTLNAGYPVVSLSKIDLNDKTMIKMSQKRFYFNNINSNNSKIWFIPLSLKSSNKYLSNNITWLNQTEGKF
jgi:aminopeptidase N